MLAASPAEAPAMRTVYQALNPIDAHLVKHALEDAGIPVFVLGEHLMGGLGELPASGLVEVRVPDSHVEDAEAVLRDLPMLAANADGRDEADDGDWLPA